MNKFKILAISGLAASTLFLGACNDDDNPSNYDDPATTVSVSPSTSVSASVEPSVSVSASPSESVSVSPSAVTKTPSCAPHDDDCSEDLEASDQPGDGQ